MLENKISLKALFLIIGFAIYSRWVPHPPNFTPILSLALFSGALIPQKWLGILAPLAVMLISDLVIGFHSSMWAVYGSIVGIILLGNYFLNQNLKLGQTLALSTVSSIFFFVITNLSVWLSSGMYPKNFSGLVSCYVAAIPFFPNTLLATALYSSVLFAIVYYLRKKEILPTYRPLVG